jgi:hypothetical protein
MGPLGGPVISLNMPSLELIYLCVFQNSGGDGLEVSNPISLVLGIGSSVIIDGVMASVGESGWS